jgi:hypothetical protein
MKPSVHWLLFFLPVTIALEHAGSAPTPMIFACAALAIVPVAALIVQHGCCMQCCVACCILCCMGRDGWAADLLDVIAQHVARDAARGKRGSGQ